MKTSQFSKFSTFDAALSQPAALRIGMRNRGISREMLASVLDVSVRAVHRWLVEEDSKEFRAMPPQQLAEILYWLAGAPSHVIFRFPRSLTGKKQLAAAARRSEKLGEEAKQRSLFREYYEDPASRPREGTEEYTSRELRDEFLAAQASLAAAKRWALAVVNTDDACITSPDLLEVIGDENNDPIFVIRGRART